MSTYPNTNNEPSLLKIKTIVDEIKNLRNQTEKHDLEKLLKSMKIDNEYFKKKNKCLNKKKIILIVSDLLIGGVGLSIEGGLIISGLAPVGSMCATSISFLSSISTLFTEQYFSKLKIRYTKLGDRNDAITLQ